MAKSVFRPGETKVEGDKVMLPLVHNYAPVEEEVPVIQEEYTGPTAEDLRKEAASTLSALFLDIRKKYEAKEISGRALDLRGLLDAVRLVRQGLTAEQALDMGLTGKCFDAQERALVKDLLALRIPPDWGREDFFAK